MSSTAQSERQGGAHALSDQADEKVEQARGAVSSAVSQRVENASAQAATQLGDISSAFRRTSHQLRGEGKDQPAKVVEAVSDRTDQLARYLSESSSSQILDDLERLGRTRPWVAIAGGLAAGVLAGRLLKASSRRRFEGYRAQYPAGYPLRSSPSSTGGTEEMPVVPVPPVQHAAGH
jgi:ElaB/YqjD/DUF883 family membrane-anchored ribosome-binding protein